MRILSSTLVLPFLLAGSLAAADPAWVGATNAAEVPGYPADRWIVGLGQEVLAATDADTAQKRAVDAARAELARSIRTRVQSSQVHAATSEARSGAAERFAESFAQSTNLTSDVELTGLRSDLCKRGDAVFALAAVERAVLAGSYREKAAKNLADAQAKAQAARALRQAQRLAEAQDAWALVVAPAAEAGEDLALVRTLGGTVPAETAEAVAAVRTEAGAALAVLAARPIASLDDCADVLARRLHGQAKEAPPVLVAPLTLRGSRVPSPFGRAAAAKLSAALARVSWPVVAAEAQAGTARERAASAGAKAVLLGSVWPQADGGASVVVEAVALADGRRLAVAEAALPAAAVAASGEALAPENAAKALADQQAFAEGEVLAQGLKLEVWTNKGDDAQIFTKGETMKVFVRVDRPCHLRLVYHLATGERVLLLDDRFIDEAKVNKVYELPDQFECAEPFGAEVLVANVSSQPFAKLAIADKDGYSIIQGDLKTQLAATRGMKKAKEDKPQLAEARLVITTVKR